MTELLQKYDPKTPEIVHNCNGSETEKKFGSVIKTLRYNATKVGVGMQKIFIIHVGLFYPSSLDVTFTKSGSSVLSTPGITITSSKNTKFKLSLI